MWKKSLLYVVFLFTLAGLSCTNDNGPTGPTVLPEPIPVESNDLFIGYESSYYFAEADSIQYIASAGYYTNMDSVSKFLPIIGLVLYNDSIEIFGIYFGGFYEGMGYENVPFMERENGIIGPYSGLWEWVGVPSADLDSLTSSVYPLPFAIYGDVSVDEVKERIERYFSNVVVGKALGKQRTIRERINY